MKKTGAEIIIECLCEQNTEVVFGYPGATVAGVFDALYRSNAGIKHVLTAHEQGAAHAADGYARLTGKTGVCIATSGPGATNLVTGIATAYMDSSPMVAITVNVSQDRLGRDSFQEVDISGITMPITKHNFIIRSVEELAPTLRRAFRIAGTGRKGPVLVDITKDVIMAQIEFERETIRKDAPAILNIVSEDELREGIALIRRSYRPMILAGGGAKTKLAMKELKLFAENINAPVAETLMGRGVFPYDSEKYIGMIGIYGDSCANTVLSECDLLIALGTRFSDRSINEKKLDCKILHIDIDPAEVNKNVASEKKIIGDAGEVLHLLNAELKIQKQRKEWFREIGKLKAKTLDEKKAEITNTEAAKGKGGASAIRAAGSSVTTADPGPLTGAYVVDAVFRITKGKAVICTEVGLNQMLAAKHYPCIDPHKFITPGGLGTMGFGLSAAIGASFAEKRERVINIAGDGSFRMNMNELITVSAYGLPIIEVILHDGSLGMVRKFEESRSDVSERYTTLAETADYVKIAEAMNIKAFRANTRKEAENIIRQALALNEPVVLDFLI